MQTFTGLANSLRCSAILAPAVPAARMPRASTEPWAQPALPRVCALTSSRLSGSLFSFLSSHSYSHPLSHWVWLRSFPPDSRFWGVGRGRGCAGGHGEGKGLLTLHLQDLVTEVGLDVVGAVGGQDQPQAAGEKQMGSVRHGTTQHPWALWGHP